MRWVWSPFLNLKVTELYAAISLREQVFIVEQNCAFLDCDGRDASAWHLLGYGDDNRLVAYLRAFPPGVVFKEACLSRVVTSPAARGTGAGRKLVAVGLEKLEVEIGKQPIRISAQAYLQRFYEGFGFERVSEEYLEDGIRHVEMLRGR